MRIWYRFGIGLIAGISVVFIAMAGGTAYLLRGRVVEAVAASQRVQAAAKQRDIAQICAELPAIEASWREVAGLSRPLAPVLHRLEWVPQVGPDLVLLPELTELAIATTAAGRAACPLLLPVVSASSLPDRLVATGKQLEHHSSELANIRQHLKDANAAWNVVSPQLDASPRLAPYQATLRQFGDRLPTTIALLSHAEETGPHLSWLLGLDTPRRYLVISQNPFELRPSGGFIGIVCLVRVEDARPTSEGCRGSGTFSARAADKREMPFAYTRYLRLSQWTLRDANWSPDFPSSARTLEQFWQLNGQPAVDGVIAVDPYALEQLLEAAGPLPLDDGTTVAADQIVNTILALYYDGPIVSDKDRLAQLLPRMVQHLLQTEPRSLPAVGQALLTAVRERHLFVTLNQSSWATLLAKYGWNGQMQPISGDTLRIVEADVGYGDVNAFVERLTHYDVALDTTGAPLTATLTLTYTNQYSPWAEAPTSHAVTGRCTDPVTLELGPLSGCYANYLRIYVPSGSQLLDVDGVEDSLGADIESERLVFGGYLRIPPGAQRVVQIRYRLPSDLPSSTVIEKQYGTLALPILVTAHTPQAKAELWTNGRTDVTVRYQTNAGGLALDGPVDPSTQTVFARSSAFNHGLAQWQRHERAAATETWRDGQAIDRALDYARAVADQGSLSQALELTKSLIHVASDGRAAFEQAALLAADGRIMEADRWYREAAERSPTNPLAQLLWVSRSVALGEPLPTERRVTVSAAATRRWLRAATELEQSGDAPAALSQLLVLHTLLPDDHSIALRYSELLIRLEQVAAARSELAQIAGDRDIWSLLAAARLAQLDGDTSTAAGYYADAAPLAITYAMAIQIGNGLHALGDDAGAVVAYERAAALAPQSIWPLLAAGNVLSNTDPLAARGWYERAQAVEPTSGHPDFAIGRLLLRSGDLVAAEAYLQTAVEKQPEIQGFRDVLTEVQTQLGRSQSPSAPAAP